MNESKEVKAFLACFVGKKHEKHVVPEGFTFSQWLTCLGWRDKIVSFKVLKYKGE